MAQGMPTLELDTLLSNYNSPTNISLVAPKINPELTYCISGPNQKRDANHEKYQNHLGSSLAAVGKAISVILNQEGDITKEEKMEILSYLNDSGRIMTNLFCNMTNVRKQFVYPLLDAKFKDIGNKIEPGEFLFGENLADKIKELKTGELTGKGLKASYSCQTNRPSTSNSMGYKPRFRQSQGNKSFFKQTGHLNRTRPTRQVELTRRTSYPKGHTSRKEYHYNRPQKKH